MNLVYIGLGSNLGDRAAMLRSAVELMPPTITPLEYSRIFETPPWGFEKQPAFLNQVIKAETSLTPHQTLARLKEIETELGRKPNFRYGPRVLDLDILLFNDLIIQKDDLAIPHPAMTKRGFVLVPLLDIAADVIHPVEQKTISELASDLDLEGVDMYKEVR